jgi:hypothetical protein
VAKQRRKLMLLTEQARQKGKPLLVSKLPTAAPAAAPTAAGDKMPMHCITGKRPFVTLRGGLYGAGWELELATTPGQLGHTPCLCWLGAGCCCLRTRYACSSDPPCVVHVVMRTPTALRSRVRCRGAHKRRSHNRSLLITY